MVTFFPLPMAHNQTSAVRLNLW